MNTQAEPKRTLVIELPDNERGRSPDAIARFDRLKRRLERTDLKPAQREAILEELLHIERTPTLHAEASEVDAGIAETIGLAEARGEEVSSARSGAKLIITHDGLRNLHERGKLSRDQYEEGQAYRRDREKRTQDMGSQLGGSGAGGSAHDNHGFVAARFERAAASAMVAMIDRAVALRLAARPTCLQMLRWVAGDGNSITAFGEGRALGRNVQALADALDIAASVRAAEKKRYYVANAPRP